jgi:hypothetical protein
MGRHVRTEDCAEDCFGCKIQTISISSAALETRSTVAQTERATEAMHTDVAAYKRLRKDGLQPKSVKGAARLEKSAGSKWEIETGQKLNGNEKLGAKLDAAQAAISKGETL